MPGQRRAFHTSARRLETSSSSHPAIPETGTWSITSLIEPSAHEELLADAELDKLHRLSALIPPPTAAEREKLKQDLAVMLRLVRAVQPHSPTGKVEMVDARPLTTHDAGWNIDLETPEPQAQKEGAEVLERETELLGKVDSSRKYAGYFVVNRT